MEGENGLSLNVLWPLLQAPNRPFIYPNLFTHRWWQAGLISGFIGVYKQTKTFFFCLFRQKTISTHCVWLAYTSLYCVVRCMPKTDKWLFCCVCKCSCSRTFQKKPWIWPSLQKIWPVTQYLQHVHIIQLRTSTTRVVGCVSVTGAATLHRLI